MQNSGGMKGHWQIKALPVFIPIHMSLQNCYECLGQPICHITSFVYDTLI